LGPEDLGAIHDLFGEYPDQPDSFDPTQLAAGDFFGIRSGPRLISVAGTHVIGRETGVAAVGNVFTHPQHRGRGHAARVSAAVVEALLERRIETIVLNVAMANQAALGLYRALGFMPFCGYYEGVGDLFGSRPEGTKAA
jgi:ribosomal protein S18 acetylase RimI-like enzyme